MIKILAYMTICLLATEVYSKIEHHTKTNALKLLNEFILSSERSSETETCLRDMRTWADGLRNQKLWAQMMVDAQYIMPPSGLLVGRRHLIARYDECINLRPENETNFSAQYCLVQIDVPSLHRYYKTLPDEPFENTLYYGACVPSGCTAQALNRTLNSLNVPITGLQLGEYAKFTVQSQHCHSHDEEIAYRVDTWIILSTLIMLAVGSLACTIVCSIKGDRTEKLVKTFCIMNNWDLLQKESTCSVGCVTGVASLGTMWVIAGTVSRAYFTAPIVNSQEVYKEMVKPSYWLWNNAQFGEDMLLLVAGLMVAIKFSEQVEKNGRYNHFWTLIKMYIRWTIPLGICIFYATSLMTQCGGGGAWNLTMDKFRTPCEKYWYFSIFYVQNYVSDFNQCLRQTWLLSAEMQLFLLSPLILLPILHHPSISVVLSTGLAVVAAATEFFLGQKHDLGPSYNFTRGSGHMVVDYIKTHTRAAPWFIGCALGIILIRIRRNENFKMITPWLTFCWLLSVGVMVGSLCSVLAFDRDYTQPTAALVLSLNRLAWGLGVAWVIFACSTGNAEPLNIFLTWRPFHFLNKLNLSMIMTHEIVIFYSIGVTREPQHLYPFRLFCFCTSLYLVTVLVSILFYVCLVRPVKILQGVFLGGADAYPRMQKDQLIGVRTIHEE